MNNRALSIDALRGYAIITMVLSATIAAGILPGWMYHAQVPPPDHVFNPMIPGLTWVDMVFPSFLFAMGAALPFSIGKRFEKGTSKLSLAANAVWRGVKLTYFAILIQHFYPYMTGGDVTSWWLAIFCFALLFPIYMRMPGNMPGWVRTTIQLSAMIVGYVAILLIDYPNGYTFNLHTSNIIILILANIALFASLLYIFTVNNVKCRLAILMILLAVCIASTVNDSWAQRFMTYSPITWFYNPQYLKYLFIVIPGCFAGEILKSWTKNNDSTIAGNSTSKLKALLMTIITLTIIIINLYCLYMRYMAINIIATTILLAIGILILRNANGYGTLWKRLFLAGSFMLLLGLAIEPFEGGIKKDPVTLSYLFTTAGLSFMTLIFFSIVCDYFRCRKSTSFLVMSGQNPMVAYVTDGLFLLPVLQICGIYQHFDIFNQTPLLGFTRGLILTALTVLITMFFTRIKWVWRT